MFMQDSRSATEAKMRLQGTRISTDCSGGIRIEYARNKFGDSVCIVVTGVFRGGVGQGTCPTPNSDK